MERSPEEYGSVRDDEPTDDTSGGPLSGGAGEGSGQGAESAPDADVPGGDPDAGPTGTEGAIEKDSERDQAEGE
jgi:hypothetical protein